VRKRREQFLKLLSLIFGAVLVLQIARLAAAKPFVRLTVPPLPVLAADVQAQKDGGTNGPGAKGDSKAGTNSAAAGAKAKSGTNAAASKEPATNGGTNGASAGVTNVSSTNQIGSGSNALASSVIPATQTNTAAGETNALSTGKPGNNETAIAAPRQSKSVKTNLLSESQGGIAGTNGGTNVLLAAGTNTAVSTNASPDGTNMAAAKNAKNVRKKGSPGGPGGPGGPGNVAELPPEIKDRVDRIVQAEILGQIMRPMPMALLGIAGDTAMLRSPEGQTGLVKEGDNLGTIKLLKIGTNRVLVELKRDGEPEKKELMIFAGLGSESLLPKETKEAKEPGTSKESREPKKPDETTKKAP